MKTEIYYIGYDPEVRKNQSSEAFMVQHMLMANIHANPETVKGMAKKDVKYQDFYKRVKDKVKLINEAIELDMYKKFTEIDLPEGEEGVNKAYAILQNVDEPHPYNGRSMMIGDIVVQGEKAWLCTATWMELENPFK